MTNTTTATIRVPNIEDIRGAVARGWCHPSNANKVMDTDLALAIADEVAALCAPLLERLQAGTPPLRTLMASRW